MSEPSPFTNIPHLTVCATENLFLSLQRTLIPWKTLLCDQENHIRSCQYKLFLCVKSEDWLMYA